MELYFHKDHRIEEWIDQVIEKLFTVCLLSGADADYEFNQGCQMVEKLASVLQDLSPMPEQYLQEGVYQLLLQRLPDDRVTGNIPAFHDIMHKMIREGVLRTVKREDVACLAPLSSNKVKQGINGYGCSCVQIQPTQEFHSESASDARVKKLEPDEENRQVFPEVQNTVAHNTVAHNTIQGMLENDKEPAAHSFFTELDKPDAEFIATASKELIKTNEVMGTNEVMENITPNEENDRATDQVSDNLVLEVVEVTDIAPYMDQLSFLLHRLLPNERISWNVVLGDQTFLAQAGKLLIYVSDGPNPCIQDLESQGFKILNCSEEDLPYPRRLERAIKSILRNPSQRKDSNSFKL